MCSRKGASRALTVGVRNVVDRMPDPSGADLSASEGSRPTEVHLFNG
jgi:hypothetical protein